MNRMYINGMSPNIEALYTPIEYPVSRGTENLSSLSLWDHTENWTLKSMVQGVSIVLYKNKISLLSERVNFMVFIRILDSE